MSYRAETFDIRQLRFQLFGYRGLPFPGTITPDNEEGYVADEFDIATQAEPVRNLKKNALGRDMLWPLSLALVNDRLQQGQGMEVDSSGYWTLGVEPIINIRGGQRVIRRYPSRTTKGGSIKERWSSDDYTLAIRGILVNFEDGTYPAEQVAALRRIVEATEVKVKSPILEAFGIQRMVIKDFDLPFETGENFQAFTLNAYSDELFDALLEDV